jgi:hypothetical protein
MGLQSNCYGNWATPAHPTKLMGLKYVFMPILCFITPVIWLKF